MWLIAAPLIAVIVGVPVLTLTSGSPAGGVTAIILAAIGAIPCSLTTAYLASGRPEKLPGVVACLLIGSVLAAMELLAVMGVGLVLFGVVTGGARLPLD